MNAEIIAIGSELLTPYRSDTNSLFVTAQLNKIGIQVVGKTIIGDDRQRLTEAVSLAWNRADLLVTIGGLGPTEDDLTRECVAAAMGVETHTDAALVEAITARFKARGMRMAEINLRQAVLVDGAEAIPNRNGTAPGQWLRIGDQVAILLPGPPRELLPMFENQCIPRLRELVPPSAIRTKVLRMVGIGESAVDEIAAPIYRKYENPATTILASMGEIQLHVTSASATETEAQARVDELCAQLESALAAYIYSTNGDTLESVVAKALLAKDATLSLAESCTGGLVGQRITSVPGSSAFFWGGAICYSNDAKMEYLDVPRALLEQYGAVSAPVARALAEGARKRAKTTIGLGITGIAGPEGGTPEKPVGLVFLALAGPEETAITEKRFMGDRDLIRWQASQIALDMIRRAMR